MGETLRLAELLSGLSVVADLGMGLEPGEAARAALVAAELAAAVGGDEIALKRAAVHTDFGDPREVLLRSLPRWRRMRSYRAVARGDQCGGARA